MEQIIKTKKQLAMILSSLKVFDKPSEKLEQYPTDSEIAAEIIWFASYLSEVKNKVIADLGAGTGLLGLACLGLGAKKVIFVDIDEKSLGICRENVGAMGQKLGQSWEDKIEFVNCDVREFDGKADIVVENPPFGVQGKKHIDREFLDVAFKTAPVVYSMHLSESEGFIKSFSDDKGYKITHFWDFNFPLKNTMAHHKKQIHYAKIGCWRLERAVKK